jgi:hypothetical protein
MPDFVRADFSLRFPKLGRMWDFLIAFDNRRNVEMQQLVLADQVENLDRRFSMAQDLMDVDRS